MSALTHRLAWTAPDPRAPGVPLTSVHPAASGCSWTDAQIRRWSKDAPQDAADEAREIAAAEARRAVPVLLAHPPAPARDRLGMPAALVTVWLSMGVGVVFAIAVWEALR